MARFRSARFPQRLAHISTTAGIVEFRDGIADVDDDERLAEALRAVPEVFGITEVDDDDSNGAAPTSDERPRRPTKSASKEEWVAYAVATLAITEQQARDMSKDRLIELAP